MHFALKRIPTFVNYGGIAKNQKNNYKQNKWQKLLR